MATVTIDTITINVEAAELPLHGAGKHFRAISIVSNSDTSSEVKKTTETVALNVTSVDIPLHGAGKHFATIPIILNSDTSSEVKTVLSTINALTEFSSDPFTLKIKKRFEAIKQLIDINILDVEDEYVKDEYAEDGYFEDGYVEDEYAEDGYIEDGFIKYSQKAIRKHLKSTNFYIKNNKVAFKNLDRDTRAIKINDIELIPSFIYSKSFSSNDYMASEIVAIDGSSIVSVLKKAKFSTSYTLKGEFIHENIVKQLFESVSSDTIEIEFSNGSSIRAKYDLLKNAITAEQVFEGSDYYNLIIRVLV